MNSSKWIYWGMVALTLSTTAFGIWGAFFADALLNTRAKMAEKRLGQKTVQIFQSTIRILSLTVAVLSSYLLFNLCRLFPCAMR